MFKKEHALFQKFHLVLVELESYEEKTEFIEKLLGTNMINSLNSGDMKDGHDSDLRIFTLLVVDFNILVYLI